MLRLRPYRASDTKQILSWSKDEKAFYKWSAGVLGEFPITAKQFEVVNNFMPFVAIDGDKIIGFFTMRKLKETFDELRFGFVIVAPEMRGQSYGKKMLQLGLKYAKETYGAKKVSLGVFENNVSAYYCYKAVGFQKVILEQTEIYHILGEEWKCIEMEIKL